MSKKKLSTRDKILDKALEMFNEKGVEYVGLRELATMLDIRVSNITYYFPTKDDLVYQLTLGLNQLNSATVVEEKNLTVGSFLGMLEKVFQNQVKYRCLMLSIVHIMEQNKAISTRHKQTQRDRQDILRVNMNTLATNGFLTFAEEDAPERLASTISLIARFWISESTISFRQLSPEAQIRYYLSLIAHLLLPYATTAGKQELIPFLAFE